MSVFRAIPFFRILLPFAAGVICFELWQAGLTGWPPLLLLMACAFFLLGRANSKTARLVFFMMADVFLFSLGGSLVYQADVRNDRRYFARDLSPGDEVSVLAYPADLPVDKGRWLRCELRVSHLMAGQKGEIARGKLLAYFRKDIDRRLLDPGKPLLLRVRLVSPQPPLNPGQFDYKTWLQRRQIHHTCFVKSGQVMAVEVPSPINPLWRMGLISRRALLASLARSGLNPQSYAICAALLTGQDDDIDRDTMAAFAHSGTLHILSVSGLHTGLLYLCLDYIFSLFVGRKKHKVLRFTFITGCLWLFALMTGFAPPVLRAVVMFNLVGYGAIFFRNDARNQLNLLCCSAFVLLFGNPLFLFDVGFLLSYFAMFGLITFTPPIMALFEPSGWLGEVVWKSVSASMAATLSTLPITLYYFKQFPFWFAICNLVVVPLSFLALLLSVLIVLRLGFVAHITNHVIAWMKWFIALFDHRGFGYVDDVDFRGEDLVFLSALIILVSLAIHSRSFKTSFAALLVLLCWQAWSLRSSFAAKHSRMLTVYHVSRNSGASVKDGSKVTYFLSDSSAFGFQLKPHFSTFNYASAINHPFNYVKLPGGAVAWLKGDKMPELPAGQLTVLVLTMDAALDAGHLRRFPGLRLVVCDGSNSAKTVEAAARLSSKFGLGFYSTAQRGALQLALK